MQAGDQQALLEQLKTVQEPIYKKSMMELGLLHADFVNGKHQITIQASAVGTEYCDAIEKAVREAASVAGVSEPVISWNLQVPARQMNSQDPMPHVRNVVLVMSGKGGVGKSTCSVNLAVALAHHGARVGLLDADIYGPSIPTMMGIQQHPVSKDGKMIEPIDAHGVRLMSIGFMVENPREAIVWRGPMLHGALNQFLTDVNWGTLDYLLMDLPPGTGDIALTLAQKVSLTGAVIVTTPQEVALQDVYKSVSMCKKLNVPVIGVVENMSYFIDSVGARHEIFGKGGGQSVAEFAEAPLIAQLPIDPSAREWGDKGTPVAKAEMGSSIGHAFATLGERLSVEITRRHFLAGGGEKAPSAQGPTRLRIVR